MRTSFGLTQLGVAPNGMAALFGVKHFFGFDNAEIGLVNDSTVVVMLTRQAKAVDAATGVTIEVDGEIVTINLGTIQADKRIIYYVLNEPISVGQVVSWSYNSEIGNILDYLTDEPLSTISPRTVLNNVSYSPSLDFSDSRNSMYAFLL